MKQIEKFTLQVLPVEDDELHSTHSNLLFENRPTDVELWESQNIFTQSSQRTL